MNANDKFIATQAHVDAAAIQPLPNSQKDLRHRFAPRHSRADARNQPDADRRRSRTRRSASTIAPVPTPIRRSEDRHPQRPAGAACRLDRRARRYRGAARLVVRLRSQPRGRRRPQRTCASTSSASRAAPRRECNVSQMHYARKGIVTPEMEFVAIRENQKTRGPVRTAAHPASGRKLRRRHSAGSSRPSSSATKSPVAAPSSPTTSTTRKPSR